MKKNMTTTIMMNGNPATGKTTTSRKLTKYLGEEHLVELLTSLSVRQRTGAYSFSSDDEKERIYTEFAKLVGESLQKHFDYLVLDGTFSMRSMREPTYRTVCDKDSGLYIVQCVVPDDQVIEQRLEERRRNLNIVENWAHTMDNYLYWKHHSEPVQDDILPDGRPPRIITYNTTTNKTTTQFCNEQDLTLNEILEALKQ